MTGVQTCALPICNHSFTAVETGDLEYLKLEKKRLETFLFGYEKQLKDESEYQKFKGDRIVAKILKHSRSAFSKSKDWEIGRASCRERV